MCVWPVGKSPCECWLANIYPWDFESLVASFHRQRSAAK
jgi:hypothetical protein